MSPEQTDNNYYKLTPEDVIAKTNKSHARFSWVLSDAFRFRDTMSQFTEKKDALHSYRPHDINIIKNMRNPNYQQVIDALDHYINNKGTKVETREYLVSLKQQLEDNFSKLEEKTGF
jgi:hypothetical protein